MSAGTPFTSTAPPPQNSRSKPNAAKSTAFSSSNAYSFSENARRSGKRSRWLTDDPLVRSEQVIVVQHPFPRPAQVHDHPLAAVQRRGIPVAEHRHTAETSRRIVHQPLLHRFPGRRNELHFGRSEPGRRDHLVVSILRPHTLSGRHLPVVRSVEARKIHVGHPFRHIGSVIRTKRVVTLVRHRLGFTVNGPFGQHRNLDAVRLIEIHERHRSRLGESFPHGGVDDLPHGLFVSELDFGLLGMDIDVDPRRVDRQVEKIGGRTGIGNQLLVSLQDRLEKIGERK